LGGGRAPVATKGEIAGGYGRTVWLAQNTHTAQVVIKKVREAIIPTHRVARDTGGDGLPGRAVAVALVDHADQFIFYVEILGVVIGRIAESHKIATLRELLTAVPKQAGDWQENVAW